jgi:hypothetical protein
LPLAFFLTSSIGTPSLFFRRSTALDYEGVWVLDSVFEANTANADAANQALLTTGSGGGLGAATSAVLVRGSTFQDNGCGAGALITEMGKETEREGEGEGAAFQNLIWKELLCFLKPRIKLRGVRASLSAARHLHCGSSSDCVRVLFAPP